MGVGEVIQRGLTSEENAFCGATQNKWPHMGQYQNDPPQIIVPKGQTKNGKWPSTLPYGQRWNHPFEPHGLIISKIMSA